MQQSHSTRNKTTESTEDKPATIIIQTPEGPNDRETIDVAHHIVNDGKVLMYFTDRRNGVDLTESLANCHICRSEGGRKLLQADAGNGTQTVENTETDPQHAVRTDGGEE